MRKKSGPAPILGSLDENVQAQLIEKFIDATIPETLCWLAREHKVRVSRSTLCRYKRECEKEIEMAVAAETTGNLIQEYQQLEAERPGDPQNIKAHANGCFNHNMVFYHRGVLAERRRNWVASRTETARNSRRAAAPFSAGAGEFVALADWIRIMNGTRRRLFGPLPTPPSTEEPAHAPQEKVQEKD